MTEYIGRYDQTYQQVNVQAQTKSKRLQFPDYKFIKKKRILQTVASKCNRTNSDRRCLLDTGHGYL